MTTSPARGRARRPLLLVLAFAAGALLLPSCTRSQPDPEKRREAMVRTQLLQRGVREPEILSAFRAVPREAFVLPEFQAKAYDDVEAPLGFGQSLDRPIENATMIRALALKPTDRVLEVGTGSGYLAALLSHIAKEVFTIEIEPPIADAARARFEKLGYRNVFPLTADGFEGWPAKAPFDAIVLTCSPDRVPEPLAAQLAEGGRLLLPLGGTEKFQELVLYTKKDGKLVEFRRIGPTTFSPMKGIIREGK